MAATTTPGPKPAAAEPPHPAAAPLAALDLPTPVAVAYSGGADSTALLHAACRRWPGQLVGLHVHHGLQAAADGFEAHCRATCTAMGVPLHVARVDARPAPGASPEDAARIARYRALATLAQQAGAATVLLAQHADDQAETVLLALGRGAGLPGLAGMGADSDRHGVRFVRPLLHVEGPALRRWLQQCGIGWVEDPSNADERLTRNRIRRQVAPALDAAWPSWRATFARSARHAAQAQAVLDEVAAADLAAMAGQPRLAGLQALSRPRQANLLRHWLRSRHGTAASAAQLEELLDQVDACRTRGHAIALKVGAGTIRREGALLSYVAA